MPFLIQLVLPTTDNDGQSLRPELARIRDELTDRFGGVTAYTRAPAEGAWEDVQGRTRRDDVIVVETMTTNLDAAWWRGYAAALAGRLRQEEVVVRAIEYVDLSAH